MLPTPRRSVTGQQTGAGTAVLVTGIAGRHIVLVDWSAWADAPSDAVLGGGGTTLAALIGTSGAAFPVHVVGRAIVLPVAASLELTQAVGGTTFAAVGFYWRHAAQPV